MNDLLMHPVAPAAFYYAGFKLEDKFQTYRTYKVMGRGSTSVLLTVDQVKTGSKIAQQQIEARTITVQYRMYYRGFQDIRQQQRQLKQYLYREEDVDIIFDDEPQIIYRGRLSKFDEEDIIISNGFFEGAFDIYCQDPLKYSKEKEANSVILADSPVETTPKRIVVKLSSSSSVQVKNVNTGSVVRITGAAIYAGDTVIFDFPNGKVYVNGVDRTSILDLESDFENFYVHKGDRLTCSNGTMTIYTREVYL